jgi:hypothetical protein
MTCFEFTQNECNHHEKTEEKNDSKKKQHINAVGGEMQLVK